MWFRNHNLVTQERNVMPADCQISNQKLKIRYQLFNRESAKYEIPMYILTEIFFPEWSRKLKNPFW